MRYTSAFTLLTLLALSVSADSPTQPYAYTLPVGSEYIFVMLPGFCRGIPETTTMSESEFEALKRQREQEKREYDGRPYTLPCEHSHLHRKLIYGKEGNGYRVSTPQYEWAARPSIKNTAGQLYPASGLYRNDGSVAPLWTVDWWAHHVVPDPNGRYLVRLGPWPDRYRQLAVAFYDRGELLNAYRIYDLVEEPDMLSESVSHFTWLKGAPSIDVEKSQVHIETENHERYVIDLTTGQVISAELPDYTWYPITVSYANNETKDYAHLSACMTDWERPGAERALFATIEAGSATQGFVQVKTRTFLIPFSQIRTLTRIGETPNGETWQVTLRDGRELRANTSYHGMRFCVGPPDGRSMGLRRDLVQRIEFW